MNPKEVLTPEEDSLSYKDALIYELHVKAFLDSDVLGDVESQSGLAHRRTRRQDDQIAWLESGG